MIREPEFKKRDTAREPVRILLLEDNPDFAERVKTLTAESEEKTRAFLGLVRNRVQRAPAITLPPAIGSGWRFAARKPNDPHSNSPRYARISFERI